VGAGFVNVTERPAGVQAKAELAKLASASIGDAP